MQKAILVIAAVALLAASTFVFNKKSTPVTEEIQRAFEKFQYVNGKNYAANEISYRLSVFAENFNKVQRMNQSNDGATYEMNKFSDLTSAEFKAIYLGYKAGQRNGIPHVPSNQVNAAIDWTTKGDVQKVKDQGQCGSCWAFSAVGSMESEDAIHGTGLNNLAEQDLVDCSRSYGNYGCNGGLMDYAFDYVKDNGIAAEGDYPYTARDGKCKSVTRSYKVKSYSDIGQGDCSGLQDAIQKQPISVAVDAESW